MPLPFSAERFLGVFAQYNDAVWPAQLGLLGLGLLAPALVAVERPWADRGVAAILAFLWAWLAIAYHLAFFAAINPAAPLFAALSSFGAASTAWHGVVHRRLSFRFRRDWQCAAGIALVVFALVGYPALSAQAGHRYPALPTFGLPCPTTLFTIGLLGLLSAPYPRSPLLAPIVWCAIGLQAAFLLGVPADFALLPAGMFGVVLLRRARRVPEDASHPPTATFG